MGIWPGTGTGDGTEPARLRARSAIEVAVDAITNEAYVGLVAAVALSIAVSTVVMRLVGDRPVDHPPEPLPVGAA